MVEKEKVLRGVKVRATKKAKRADSLSRERLIELYQEMLFYRRFEERVNLAYMQQKFSGFCHLHIGQEAVCVGVQACLTEDDYMISSYRSHTQSIAKGISPESVFAELLGKKTGCSKGKGGSMHMFSRKHRFLGGHGIVGGQAPLATGVAFALRYREEPHLVVCYLGDAAMNQGQVFEAMNMAAIWSLPVLFVIENNQYGMGTAINRVSRLDKLHHRGAGFGVQSSEVDGMEVTAVYDHVSKLCDDIRKNPKPHLLEAHTYRYKGHSVSDPATYRSKEEVEKYREKDPLIQLQSLLLKNHKLQEDDFITWDKEAKAKVKAAELFAEKSQEPELDEVMTDVFVAEE